MRLKSTYSKTVHFHVEYNPYELRILEKITKARHGAGPDVRRH
jgi:hypothetical protein